MGRYIGTGSAQPNTCSTFTSTTCYAVNTHKYSYDATSCWQNRVIIDTPGSYTFTVPTGITCFRAIAVGGGGKAKCTNGNCCGHAGAGGGYVERWDTVTAGTVVTVVVGRQEQDTTISYTNAGSTLRTLTGGGAAGCIPGAASGGDWNSTGGAAGFNCSYCGGSVSHYCGSCLYTYATTCCGYCVVWGGTSAHGQLDAGHDANGCCTNKAAGGGSAGSWIWTTGGGGQCAGNWFDIIGQSYGAVAAGGGGIGVICRNVRATPSVCSCICIFQHGYSGPQSFYPNRNMNYPSGAGGGSGSKYQLCMGNYDYGGNISNYCVSGVYKTGAGGWGGKNTDEGREEVMHYHCMPVPNNHGVGNSWMIPAGPSPRCYPWHDIHEMAGSGSAGRAMFETSYRGPCSWATYGPSNPLAFDNAGEGAGTGGVAYHCCELTSLGFSCFYQGTDACGTVNWTLLCCLGTSGRVCCADKMTDVLFPYILSCAGTLGGSGGTTLCHVASKAGKGGGAGIYRSYITCVCWGGSFDLCNGSGPALAFPPCALDWRVSTAGTGMAVLYWKDTN